MELYKVELCRGSTGCPRAVGDTNELKGKIENIFKKAGFVEKRLKQLGANFKQHIVFKVGLAGCANCCSQPQIKDFALIAKALPTFNIDLCNLCGICVEACKEKALKLEGGNLAINEDKCLGCGDCWRTCPVGAIRGGESKWRLMVGGKLGRHPRLAQELKDVYDREGLMYLEKAIAIFLTASDPHKRFAQLLEEENISFS
ncbi:MAG: hypothetical protein JM58_18080 [Peptococcaceae bacterium BICA1-8]|nr:MAG: hypothetical protein JM58_18080 [Peptococcaceae bacterium BICA1-8]